MYKSIGESQKLTQEQFEKYCKLIKAKLGVHISAEKYDMVQAKVAKLTRNADIQCYDQYYKLITSDNNVYWKDFVDEITTHKTNFFREPDHFDFIKKNIDKILEKKNEIRVWSSACSTGEEAYTLAIVLNECVPSYVNIKILATDISSKVVRDAQRGSYIFGAEDLINAYYISKYFSKEEEKYIVNSDLKNLINFRVFNLMHSFPFKNNFDIIFCRNVMIYFDVKTQEELIQKFYNILGTGGLLFIGHSESLNQKKHNFKYIQPTIYTKL